ncbi:hypothetical protein M7I_2585 [Glarea lozoyensis 74030]|uniref:Uncharacterized protein n=1 Tax=Glarea lozoyensis (strain ATCC 74030 / MF5533) TaxID=1104152 RepID=H0EJ61_GLAL7|nr:hypothetical protein M7I_2585 [Glarea lozoyensis 74030]
MEQRSKLKAETRIEKVREEYEPVEDIRDVEQFIDHARDTVRSVNYSTKSVARRANMVRVVSTDFYDAANIATKALATLDCIPKTHISALESYINTSRKSIERSYNSLSRSTRWPLGLLDETRQRLNEEKEEKVRKTQEECAEVGRELRYTQQVVASELAGWQDLHEKMGKKALRDLAKGMIIRERTALEGMMRAVRKLKLESAKQIAAPVSNGRVEVEVNASAVAAGPSNDMD